MKRFDWQAYEDGSMDAATRAQAEHWLAESEQARAELESLREFRASLRAAALAEPVPVERLNTCLAVAVRQGKGREIRRVFFWSGGLAFAACLALLVVFLATPRIDDVSTPVVASETTVHEPMAVRDWLASETGMPVPEIRLAGLDASIDGASHGKDWVAWKVTMCGRDYTIYGRQSQDWLDRGQVVEEYPKPIYVDGRHVGWYCAMGMAYVIKGGTPEGRLELARKACLETPSAVRLNQARPATSL